MWYLIILAIIIIYLIFIEYKTHDAIGGKKCLHQSPAPEPNDPPAIVIRKLYNMTRTSYSYVRWRISLIVALIVALPIGYFLTRKILPIWALFVTIIIIFIGVYFGSSWIYAHFHYPTCRQIERNLLLLGEKIDQIMAKKEAIEQPEQKPQQSEDGPSVEELSPLDWILRRYQTVGAGK
jgi:hypothetical protein